MQFTKLKMEAILEHLQSAQDAVERAMYAKELMDSMKAPSDAEILAREAVALLPEIFDKIEEAKTQLTISGK